MNIEPDIFPVGTCPLGKAMQRRFGGLVFVGSIPVAHHRQSTIFRASLSVGGILRVVRLFGCSQATKTVSSLSTRRAWRGALPILAGGAK
jgi:hypothetical protein